MTGEPTLEAQLWKTSSRILLATAAISIGSAIGILTLALLKPRSSRTSDRRVTR